MAQKVYPRRAAMLDHSVDHHQGPLRAMQVMSSVSGLSFEKAKWRTKMGNGGNR